MKKPALIASVLIAVVLFWHAFLSLTARREYCSDPESPQICKMRVTLEINPLTDVATVKMPGASSFGITDRMGTLGFNWGRSLTGGLAAENQLNLYARQYLDVYAMILAYRVRIVDSESERPSSLNASASSATNQQLEVSVWPNVVVLGFRAGDSVDGATEAAFALGMKGLSKRGCANREYSGNVDRDYVDCEFSGDSPNSMELSFFQLKLQKIEYQFSSGRYGVIHEEIEKSFGKPRSGVDSRTGADMGDQWGGYTDGFSVTVTKPYDEGSGSALIVFSPKKN